MAEQSIANGLYTVTYWYCHLHDDGFRILHTGVVNKVPDFFEVLCCCCHGPDGTKCWLNYSGIYNSTGYKKMQHDSNYYEKRCGGGFLIEYFDECSFILYETKKN